MGAADAMPVDRADLLTLTAQIVSAHCMNNTVAADALPGLVHRVHAALTAAEAPAESVITLERTPAVPIKRSVFPDYIICLEDGKKLKMFKRHLQSAYGLTPADYRTRWDLPADYPMVAPNYAEKRSALAKKIGLGRRSGEPDGEEAVATMPVIRHLPERKRGRKVA